MADGLTYNFHYGKGMNISESLLQLLADMIHQFLLTIQ